MRRFAELAAAVATAAVLVVAVAACGGAGGAQPVPPRPPAGEGSAMGATGGEGGAGGAGATGGAGGEDGAGGAPAAGSGAAAANEPAAADPAVCKNRPDMFGPVYLDAAQIAARYGQNARTYADAPTTKARPVEVCGIPASRQWLRGTACADGAPARQNGRIGSVGPGGQCGSIIDLYSVTCPEGDHKIFIDMYMCGPGEAWP